MLELKTYKITISASAVTPILKATISPLFSGDSMTSVYWIEAVNITQAIKIGEKLKQNFKELLDILAAMHGEPLLTVTKEDIIFGDDYIQEVGQG